MVTTASPLLFPGIQVSCLYLLTAGEAIDSNDLQRFLRAKTNRILGIQSKLGILVPTSCLLKIQETMLRKPILVTRLNNTVIDSKEII